MRFLQPVLLGLSLVSSAWAQDAEAVSGKQRHSYQSDVARLRNIVINSLYSHREVFLRELISNANDALEKLRMTSLTNREYWDGGSELNVTIRAYPGQDGKPGRLVITDNGIGMTKEELTANLGTLAKSGTTEFLSKTENNELDAQGQGNLIGAFGVGFYSSFLVADRVFVASVPAEAASDPNAPQWVFASTAAESDFDIYEDPRGRTLQRGTEITLVLKPDAEEYLDQTTIAQLIGKHSTFSTSFPIYTWEKKEERVPVEKEEKPEVATPEDEDEAVFEEETEDSKTDEPEFTTVEVERWVHSNPQPPLWTMESKNITSFEYELFYQTTFKDFQEKPLAWHHFSGDLGSGVSFKALLFIPGHLPESFWNAPLQDTLREIKLMVKRVFITSDMGEGYLPKWASWLKAVVDADDLPLNVSRETLQNTSFLKQIKNALLKRIIQTFTKIMEEDDEKFRKIHKVYGNVFKLGAVEDEKNKEKLAKLVRLNTNQREFISLDEYVENKKEGQKQLYYLADLGKTKEDLMRSVFVEKLHARGYEVILLTDPIDELFVQNLRKWQGIPFQDAAKQGLKFGDEKLDPEEEKAQLKAWKEKFAPLTKWLKTQADQVVRQVVVSDRLVTSPCAIFADERGFTANMQRMLQNGRKAQDKDDPARMMQEYYARQKTLEINPRSPLIEGLLKRLERLADEEDEDIKKADEEELKEVAAVLIDGALVRSGFEVWDSNLFMTRVDRVLRRSLGVDENAPTEAKVKPAPPTDPEILDEAAYEPEPEEDDGEAKVVVPDHLKEKVAFEMEEISDEEYEEMMRGPPPTEDRVTVDEVLGTDKVELPVEEVVEEHETEKVKHEEL